MAGHSHAKNVAKTKEKQDAKKAKRNTLIAKKLTILASTNPNPDTNPTLENEIKKARSMGFPKENVEKILKNASGKGKDELKLERLVMDAYWNNIAIVIVTETDKSSRTAPEIKNLVSKCGGEVKAPGTATYLFNQVGLFTINTDKLTLTKDDLESLIIDSSCEDYSFYEEEDEDGSKTDLCDVHFPVDGFATLAGKLSSNLENHIKNKKNDSEGFVEEEDIAWIASATKDITGDKEKFNKLISTLEDHEEVVAVYHDANV